MADRKNDFSKGSIPRNIMSMAIPMTLAQLVSVLYNVVDRMYLGRLPGHLALTGIGLCMPIISIIMGFANLWGGGSPLCSIYRGKGDEDEAERVMCNAFVMVLLSSALMTVSGLIFCRPLLYLFGGSDDTVPYAVQYITIYLCGNVFAMTNLGLVPYVNAQGFGKMGMASVLLGAVVNIILDPIFIFALDMGVQGAAIATVIAQACSAGLVMWFLTSKHTILRLRFSACKLQWTRLKRIAALGLSNLIINLTNSLVQILCNTQLQTYGGDLYVGVMTVINSIREVISMPVMGLSSGTRPVIGFNYGAGLYSRVRKGIRFAAIITVTYSVAVWLLVMLAPGIFIRIFDNEPDLINAGIASARIYFAAFFGMAFQFVGQSAFIGLGKAKYAIFFSLLRKAVIVAPLTAILPRLGLGVDGVFLAEPISDVLGGLVCGLTMYFVIYRKLGSMPDEPRPVKK